MRNPCGARPGERRGVPFRLGKGRRIRYFSVEIYVSHYRILARRNLASRPAGSVPESARKGISLRPERRGSLFSIAVHGRLLPRGVHR